MNEDDDKIVIIHQYSTDNIQPFLNPICKNTYNALPKIYGNETNKRYIYKIKDLFKYHPTRHQRQCCIIQQLQKQKLSHSTKNKIKKRVNNGLIWIQETQKPLKFNKIRQSNININRQKLNLNSRMMTEVGQRNSSMIKKQNKILLPNLKVFQNDLIQQSETKHKVITPIRRNEFKLNLIKSSQMKNNVQKAISQNKQFKKNNLRESQTQTQINYQYSQPQIKNQPILTTNTKNVQQLNSRQTKQAISAKQLKQAKYQALAQRTAKKQVKLIRNKPLDKVQQVSEEYNKLTQSQTNTVFHDNKLRYSKINKTAMKKQRKQRLSYSVLSNGLFKIPQEDEIEDYIINYKPMNPQFVIQKLVKEPNFNIVPNEGNIYFGQIKQDQKHGKGITITQKQLYEGLYIDDKKHFGFQKTRDGIFSGEFLNGMRHGKGRFQWANGQSYEGEWRNGKKNGIGIWRSPKGDFYEGQWKQNRQNGKGYHYHHGGSVYRGYFKDYLKQGKGQEQFANGDKYNGQYYQGKPNGFGKYIWKNGDIYEGNFIDGSREGKGLLQKINGEKYEGQFKNDLKEGFGKQKLRSGEIFEGIFKLGQRIQGKMTTKAGQQIYISQK